MIQSSQIAVVRNRVLEVEYNSEDDCEEQIRNQESAFVWLPENKYPMTQEES